MTAPSYYHRIADFDAWRIRALVTTRAAGSFSTASDESVSAVMHRWDQLREHVASGARARLATARQVHGAELIRHEPGWTGWLRGGDADGHVAVERGTAVAVSIADCVPVFVAHPSGAIALLHSGWRGTASGIVERAVRQLAECGAPADELRIVLGPAICGPCYEVSPEVYHQLTGRQVVRPTTVDLRALIADHAGALGVRDVRLSPHCTRCDAELFYSHRGGDAGRQVAVLVADLVAADAERS